MFAWAPTLEAQNSMMWLAALDPWATTSSWPSWRHTWSWKRFRKKPKKHESKIENAQKASKSAEVDTKVELSANSSQTLTGKQRLLAIMQESRQNSTNSHNKLKDSRRESSSTGKTIVLDVLEDDSGLGEDHSAFLDESSKSESLRTIKRSRNKCVTIKENNEVISLVEPKSIVKKKVRIESNNGFYRDSVEGQRRILLENALHFVTTQLEQREEDEKIVLRQIFHYSPVAVRLWLLKLQDVHIVSKIFTVLHHLLFSEFWRGPSTSLELILHCLQSFLSLLALHVAMEMELGSVQSVVQNLSQVRYCESLQKRVSRTREAFLLLWTHLITH